MDYIVLISIAFVIYFISSQVKVSRALKDPNKWEAFVRERKLTPEKQIAIINKLKIQRPIIDLNSSRNETTVTTTNNFDSDFTTIWTGNTKNIEFTYHSFKGDKERREIRPTEVCFNSDGDFYIKGFCLLRNQPRTFKQKNIKTKIKVGSNRYYFDEWCSDVLHIDIASCPNPNIYY